MTTRDIFFFDHITPIDLVLDRYTLSFLKINIIYICPHLYILELTGVERNMNCILKVDLVGRGPNEASIEDFIFVFIITFW
jgi:hypothetical protein